MAVKNLFAVKHCGTIVFMNTKWPSPATPDPHTPGTPEKMGGRAVKALGLDPREEREAEELADLQPFALGRAPLPSLGTKRSPFASPSPTAS